MTKKKKQIADVVHYPHNMKLIFILFSILYFINHCECENIYVARLDLSDETNNNQSLTFDSFVNQWHCMCLNSHESISQLNVNFVDCTKFERLEQCLLLIQNENDDKSKFVG
jgi:hypothetical protein